MTLKKLFLPIGLILAVCVAMVFPSPGTYLKANGAVKAFIVIIFLVNGFQMRKGGLALSRRLVLTLGFAAVLSLGIGPLLGSGIARILSLPASLAMGLVIMSAVPPTLSSGIVITEVSGGNTSWALLLTLCLNLLGVLVVPFTLKWFLSTGADITIDPFPLLYKLLLLVLLPFGIGLTIKRLTGGGNWDNLLKYIPSTCVILTVLAGLSASRETILATPLSQFPVIVLAVILIHLLLLVLTLPGANALNLDAGQRRALMFVGSQKTLPIAISVLAALGDDIGKALIVCLLFHFAQLIIDSFIAARLSSPSKPAADPAVS